jgi:CheY-like chemotaxis protein
VNVQTRLILVIEDSGDDAALLRVAFRKAGFDNPIQCVERVEQALEYLDGQGEYGDRGRFPFPRLIMLDHKMPGDGWPVIEWVRARANLSALPVVVFSGSEDPNHQKKACDLGANAYHVKPQKFEDFIEVVKRIGDFWLRSFSPEPKP